MTKEKVNDMYLRRTIHTCFDLTKLTYLQGKKKSIENREKAVYK